MDGETFTIIQSTAPIVGTFNGLAEGASLTIDGVPFHITYQGGGGDDVVLTQAVVAAPTVTGLNPSSGPAAGGTLVTITGTGFTGATAVDFGTTAATNLTVVNDTTITADSSAGTGTEDVTVITPAGTSAKSSADQFTYVAAPTVSGLNLSSGPAAGGTLVTITGIGFTGATAVDFGTTAATNLTVVNDTTITADSPAGTGTVDVTVITPASTSAKSFADQFTYVAAPTVTGVSPNSGPTAGGTTVTITGTGFTGASAVDFGMDPATGLTVVNDTTITADSPAGNGTVDVTVITPAATSATFFADAFTYTAVAAATVTGISPNSGPAAGGTLVTITGTGFSGATAVDFGTSAATGVTFVSATTITADSPAGTGTGTVDVTVITPAGRSASTVSDRFTYIAAAAPSVTGVSLNSGPTAGGTTVTIAGTGFTGVTTVDFGTTAATDFTVVNDTTITVDSPAGTGSVDLTVVTPGGTSATLTADRFTYIPVAAAIAPTVTSVSSNSGPTAGGTTVTIIGTGFSGVTAVDFGTTAATGVTLVSATTITADSPAGTSTVDVTVTTPAGTSAASAADHFTYTAATSPTITSLSRFGFHSRPTSLVIQFDGALDPASAEDKQSYTIIGPAGARSRSQRLFTTPRRTPSPSRP